MSTRDYDLTINAANIHSGGGMVLLQALLKGIKESQIRCLLLANERLRNKIAVSAGLDILFVEHTIAARLKNEYFLRRVSQRSQTLLLFGNLPPLFRQRCETVLYIQSVYIIPGISLSGFPLTTKIRLILEQAWFRLFKRNVDRFAVQTDTTKSLVSRVVREDIELLPFADLDCSAAGKAPGSDFIYPSSGEPHKNHKTLIEAWILLAAEGHYPQLHITLDERLSRKLLSWIAEKVNKHGLKIRNIGHIESHPTMLRHIERSQCVIFPSLVESLGLPLLEAKCLSVPIIASELDYVRNIVDPRETFNPNSPRSICTAVLRFLNVERDTTVMDSKAFVSKIMGSRSAQLL